MKRAILVLLTVLATAGSPWARPDRSRPADCSQGEFARQLAYKIFCEHQCCEHEGDEHYDVGQAIERLNLCEIAPVNGWKPEAPLTRKVMGEVLAVLHAHYSAQKPEQVLTVPEVAGFLAEGRAEDAFHRFHYRGQGCNHHIYCPYYPMPAYTH